jgi:hypothetical protein
MSARPVEALELPPSREEGVTRSAEIQPLGGGRHALRLWGPLHRNWADRLSRGLTLSRIAIVRGYATRETSAGWLAAFEIDAARAKRDPMLIDYLQLLDRELRGPIPPIRIETHRIEPSDQFGGSLCVQITGRDRLGFLGGVLERFAFLSLVPDAMSIESDAGLAFDGFFLRMTDGAAPSQATARLLEEALRGRILDRGSEARRGPRQVVAPPPAS